MNRILIVEDDENLSLLYQSALKNQRFEVFRAENGLEALTILDQQYIDLIISDIMMPDMDGYELAQSLREANYELPILFITAKDSFEDKKRGFMLGIDDYMVKPIDVNEMILRVEALLRRAQIVHTKELIIGKTQLNQETYQVKQANQEMTLPQKEFLLLYKLLAYPNKIFTRQQLMDEIWGLDSDTDERTIDVHIKRLRTRLESNPDFSIETIRGLGYKAVIRS
ncbi:response regulator transcription factor [Enterococcus hermanniensis]|uniref:Heme response regulator HssR n=1 Tax=Enterococcus hermanniensis TaxID=249189 RepID=A0A1L8TS11_9ENTE|nr:response regulator transcription factor [Enterococcus hermanniensis]OJG47003.1 DNA-binding response regulator [Enterococcus hermanniensis]